MPRYGNILNDNELTAALSNFGYTRAKLADEKVLVDQVSAKNLQQKKEIGEAQNATAARDKKLDELAKWISDLRAVAKVALTDSPQQLEKLGILARSSTKAQKAAKNDQPPVE